MSGKTRPDAATVIALLAGLLPIIAVHAAYLLNLTAGAALEERYVCFPYFEGCVSVSRAVRAGPGLHLFRALVLPSAVLVFLSWLLLNPWLRRLSLPRRPVMTWIGCIGALFLVIYGTWLGTEGEWYNWLRRYGVTFYFGFTALAQLLLLNTLWPRRHELCGGRLALPVRLLGALVLLQLTLGVFSAVKRLLFSDPAFIDRLENITEWCFALPMSLVFVVLAMLLGRSGFQTRFSLGD